MATPPTSALIWFPACRSMPRIRPSTTGSTRRRSPSGQRNVQGNLGRYIANGPGMFEIDSSLQKRFKITERVALNFRAAAYNLANHPIYKTPSGSIGALTGQSAGGQRQLRTHHQHHQQRRRREPALRGASSSCCGLNFRRFHRNFSFLVQTTPGGLHDAKILPVPLDRRCLRPLRWRSRLRTRDRTASPTPTRWVATGAGTTSYPIHPITVCLSRGRIA